MGMFRITLQKMLILIRLVIVVSLAGYSLPTASAAMHGAWSDLEVSQPRDHQEVASGEHVHGNHDQSPDDAQKLAKTDCCQGFCVSMAIVSGSVPVGGPQVASIREFIDDAHIIGELPTLHRPPNI
ncbi:hypothetical protein I6F26_33005 [Ensifer sp. IC3342]|nr:hypothetical protein [Ensifer sp. BRP08]MCA1451250.1 hypothetical protein [Ensifer sp. IC3342]